jgi:hypothetical protein
VWVSVLPEQIESYSIRSEVFLRKAPLIVIIGRQLLRKEVKTTVEDRSNDSMARIMLGDFLFRQNRQFWIGSIPEWAPHLEVLGRGHTTALNEQK